SSPSPLLLACNPFAVPALTARGAPRRAANVGILAGFERVHGGITLAGRAAGKAALAVLCLAALALAVPSTARAEGGLFGALIRLFTGAPPSPPSERAPPRFGWDEAPAKPRAESGGGAAYCVRTCDGRYFPIG